jgi:hypothetical protein
MSEETNKQTTQTSNNARCACYLSTLIITNMEAKTPGEFQNSNIHKGENPERLRTFNALTIPASRPA